MKLFPCQFLFLGVFFVCFFFFFGGGGVSWSCLLFVCGLVFFVCYSLEVEGGGGDI